MNQLNDVDPEEIKQRIFKGESIKALAIQYQVTPQEVLAYCGNPFVYSHEWYDYAYHQQHCKVDSRNFQEVREDSIKAGYKKRLLKYLSEIKIPNTPIYWLEVGCHLGMTACTVLEKYPNIQSVHMIDFSVASIDWCQKQFPYPDRAQIWPSSCSDIQYPNVDLSNRYHVVSCFDVTEHLPNEVYLKTIKEIYRVLRPYGIALVQQGNYPHPSHINIKKENELCEDFINQNFEYVQNAISKEKNTYLHVFRKMRED
ncbi:MAG: class I SAM-dependent methyltransferase [Candidatus Hinthialibacter antarcticus]|nr:class I SAM-dependent methyltransferase [Candidatus Hinthialibacter antarcticus]